MENIVKISLTRLQVEKKIMLDFIFSAGLELGIVIIFSFF